MIMRYTNLLFTYLLYLLTLQCCTWLWDHMTVNSPGGSTVQCVTFLCHHNNSRWRHK